MKQWLMLAAVVALCGMTTGCKGKTQTQNPVNGILEESVTPDSPSEDVMEVCKRLAPGDDRLETVMEDKANAVTVWSLLKCSDEVSSEGYGMLVAKDGVTTVLPRISHGRMPRARYDAATGDLWVIGSYMEGTGVNVELPYLLRFGPDGHATVESTINPYDIQREFCQMLTYSIKGQDITFYCNGKELVKVTNQIKDMGDFMDDAIYVGEQIAYSTDGPLTVHVTPGLNFVTGKVLHYDDMPTFSATVTVEENGAFKLGELKVDQ